jgi:hypothetical protein
MKPRRVTRLALGAGLVVAFVASPAAAGGEGTLPVTGMPLGWIVGAAATLFSLGLLLLISDVRRNRRERARESRRGAARASLEPSWEDSNLRPAD